MKFEEWLSQQNGVIEVDCGCVTTEAFYHWMRVAYEAGNSPVIPDGYVMVPIEPTEDMCDISHIGVDVYCGITDDNEYYSIGGVEAAKVWKAMLAAAPQSPGSEPATVPELLKSRASECWDGIYNAIKGRGKRSEGDFTPDLNMSTEEIIEAINNRVSKNTSDNQNDCVMPPDKWIPVSERMPEDEQEVLTINKMGHRFVSFFDKHSGLFFDRLDAPAAYCIEHVLVTHWMPLPNPPKE
ncbi:DUF551 domain-containing protein [Klebsiella pneumoniae]